MATAYCQNDDCEKDDWTLQKHPDDYARGVSCPECGSTRVEVEGDLQQREQPTQDRQQAQAPATRDPQTQQARAPARQQDHEIGAIEGAIALTDEDTDAATKGKAAQSLFGKLADAASTAFQYREQKKQARDENAKNVDLAPKDEYPACEECGYQFTGDDIALSATSVQCPECGKVFDIIRPQPDIQG